jgi:hypothetical protein
MEDDEATRLILQTLFDIRAAVFEMHDALLGDEGSDDDDEEDR